MQAMLSGGFLFFLVELYTWPVNRVYIEVPQDRFDAPKRWQQENTDLSREKIRFCVSQD